MDIIHGYHPWIISIDITHGIPWGVPWDPRGGTMGTPWVGSLSLLGLMGPLGLIGPLGLMGPQGLMGPGPWALGGIKLLRPANNRPARGLQGGEGEGSPPLGGRRSEAQRHRARRLHAMRPEASADFRKL